MKQAAREDLKQAAGENNVFWGPKYKYLYSYDAHGSVKQPGAVVFVNSAAQVRRIVRVCIKHRLPIVARGSGSGMTGGSVITRNNTVVLVFSKFKKVLSFEPQNLMVRVQPGIINGDLNKYLRKRGFFYPPDPASADFSTIGGNIAENAGGPSAVKYGVTGDYVLNLRVVLGTGQEIYTRRNVLKSVSAYDLTHLFVGSEGTLGIITEATLRILPVVPYEKSLLVGFSDYAKAADLVAEIYRSGILPKKMEFLDEKAIRVVEAHSFIPKLPQDIKALLLVAVESAYEDVLKRQIYILKRALRQLKPDFMFSPRSVRADKRIWELRKAVSPSLYKFKPVKVNEDIVVPIDKLENLFHIFKNIEQDFNVDIISFGHIGDGNLHTNIMMERSQLAQRYDIKRRLFEGVVQLGGSISGEHGIGITKREFLSLEYSEYMRKLHRQLKRLFDPYKIMNPGKKVI